MTAGGEGVKEGAARAVLRDVWRQGHETVELRQDGKRLIFFCTLCSTRCYSDCALSDHLKGNLHAKRYAATAAPQLLSSPSPPWPFNDGLVFLFPSSKTMTTLSLSLSLSSSSSDVNEHTRSISGSSRRCPLKWIGCGHVYMRVLQSTIPSLAVAKAIWCCWLGEKQEQEQEQHGGGTFLAECEYAIVSFPYTHTLGRGEVGGRCAAKANGDNLHGMDMEMDMDMNIDKKKRKKKKRRKKKGASISNFHPPMFEVETSNSSSSSSLAAAAAAAQHLSSPKELKVEVAEKASGSHSHSNSITTEAVDDLHLSRVLSRKKNMSNRALRRAFRRQRLQALERLCFICHQQMLPGKDVAALLNRKSGLIACSSRNKRGSFHVFHTSCLIDWVLLCESKIWLSHMHGGKGGRCRKSRWSVAEHQQRRKQQVSGSGGNNSTAGGSSSSECTSVFCPECQGTGLKTRGGQLEVPRYRLAQVFDWILELIQSRKSWIDHPEQLQECATGLLFSPADDGQGNVISMLLLHFYGCNGSELYARSVPDTFGRAHIV